MTGPRFDGADHTQIYTWVQQGPAGSGAADAQAVWTTAEQRLVEIDSLLAGAIRDLDAGWEGEGSDAARRGLTPVGAWASDAAGKARTIADALQEQSVQAAWVRNSVPVPPAHPESEKPPLSLNDPGIDPYIQADWAAAAGPQREAAQRAVEVMNTYSDGSLKALMSYEFADPPPAVTVDVSNPPAGGAVTGGPGFDRMGGTTPVGTGSAALTDGLPAPAGGPTGPQVGGPAGSQAGALTGPQLGNPTGSQTGGPTGSQTGGPTGSQTGGPTGSQTGGPTGSQTGGPTGSLAGGVDPAPNRVPSSPGVSAASDRPADTSRGQAPPWAAPLDPGGGGERRPTAVTSRFPLVAPPWGGVPGAIVGPPSEAWRARAAATGWPGGPREGSLGEPGSGRPGGGAPPAVPGESSRVSTTGPGAGASGRPAGGRAGAGSPGMMPMAGGGGAGGQGGSRRRPAYLIDDSDAFVVNLPYTRPVINIDDPAPD